MSNVLHIHLDLGSLNCGDCDGGKKFKNNILIKEPAMEILLYLA